MSSRLALTTTATLAFVAVLVGQANDFSGEWRQDREKTEGASARNGGASRPRGGCYADLTVTQDASRLTVKDHCPNGPVLDTIVYRLDGKPTFLPAVPPSPTTGGPGGKPARITTAKWNGDKLTTSVRFQTEPEIVVVTTWYLEADLLVLEDGGEKVYYKR
jgi:hypothetical protein